MRPEIRKLMELGRLPSDDEATVDIVRNIEKAYREVTRPVTDEEAKALVQLFGFDGCFGLSSSIMHLIETAPNWPLKDALSNVSNPWVMELRKRAIRGGRMK